MLFMLTGNELIIIILNALKYFLNFSILISDIVNNDWYNPHKQNLFGFLTSF